MSATAGRGRLIVFEGLDGAGKTTQLDLLREWLERAGLSVVATREPTSGPHGRRLRRAARRGRLAPRDELDAFLADRREHVAAEIVPALREGRVVLVDRYYLSSAAYQGARGLDPQEIIRLNESFAPRPDLIVLIEIPVEQALERIRRRGGANLFERAAELRRVAAIFAELRSPALRRIDGARPASEVHAEIAGWIAELLPDGPGLPQLAPPAGGGRSGPA